VGKILMLLCFGNTTSESSCVIIRLGTGIDIKHQTLKRALGWLISRKPRKPLDLRHADKSGSPVSRA